MVMTRTMHHRIDASSAKDIRLLDSLWYMPTAVDNLQRSTTCSDWTGRAGDDHAFMES